MVIIYGLIVLVLFILAALYGYTEAMKNMSYAVFLIAFFGICGGVFDFVRYRDRQLKLLWMAGVIGERDYHLPRAASLEERLYQEMIMALEEEKRRLVTEYDEKKRDMADYYTMWIHQIKTPIAALGLLLEGREGAMEDGRMRHQAEEE